MYVLTSISHYLWYQRQIVFFFMNFNCRLVLPDVAHREIQFPRNFSYKLFFPNCLTRIFRYSHYSPNHLRQGLPVFAEGPDVSAVLGPQAHGPVLAGGENHVPLLDQFNGHDGLSMAPDAAQLARRISNTLRL